MSILATVPRGSALLLLALCIMKPVSAQTQIRYSTHDQTPPIIGAGEGGSDLDFAEWWADAKTPGDGLIYSVGTVEIAQVGPFFSGSIAQQTTGLPTFPLIAPATRQVVMLQAAVAGDGQLPGGQPIAWQRYFYGITGTDFTLPSNARAVSVWPAEDPVDTRVAIAGETFDDVLPMSQTTSAAPTNSISGFVAVYNGLGDLLWTHQFFGATGGRCAITDISVRVDFGENGTPLTDYITYVGLSTHGNPTGGNGPLTPVNPFTAPTPMTGCSSPASGDTDNGSGQWDGIVGRLMRPHDASQTTQTVFHSVVGGIDQDGLFGVAEINKDQFVAVGGTGAQTGFNATQVGSGGATFPTKNVFGQTAGNNELCFGQLIPGASNYGMGVLMLFDASGGTLSLLSTLEIGDAQPGSIAGTAIPASNLFTTLRDVMVYPGWQTGADLVLAVGSTTDPNAFDTYQSVGLSLDPQDIHGGGVDGIIFTAFVDTASIFTPFVASYRGGTSDEWLTGIGDWNEFAGHFNVAGSVGTNIDAGSYYLSGEVLISDSAISLTDSLFGGGGNDWPAAMGSQNATDNAGSVYRALGIGPPAGGGIAVDETGRVNIVGATDSISFPVVGSGARPKVTTSSATDGFRTVLDLLPDGVGRTDGTGSPVPASAMLQYPLSGFYGGTTPECALSLFGSQIGVDPAGSMPPLARMLIDYEGLPPAVGVSPAFVVVRPPRNTAGSNIVGMAVQLEFPGGLVAPPPVYLPDGALMWCTNNALAFGGTLSAGETFRLQWQGTLPSPGGYTVVAQLVCLLASPVAGGASGPACPVGGASFTVASSALWFTY